MLLRKFYGKMLVILLLTASFSAGCGGRVTVSGAQEKMIALTFDDGPSPTETSRLLDGLAARNAKATFFIVGENIDPERIPVDGTVSQNRELVCRMKREGHEVGNHTYSHCFLSKVKPGEARDEINKTSVLIAELTGEAPRYLRPPGGAALMTPQIRTIAAPLITVCWSDFDTRDWQCRDIDRMVQMIVSGVRDGSIVLLHDLYPTSVDTALRAVDLLREQGYRFVTVDTLLKRNLGDEYELDPARVYYAMADGELRKLKRKNDQS